MSGRSPDSAGRTQTPEPRPSHRGLVLVIEDETVIADVIRRYLTAAGFGVQICGTGRDGLAALRRDRPVAIVLDIGLPDMDGLDLCRQLRAAGDWTPILFVTARDEDIDRILGLEMGGDDYLVKPFNPRELVARLRAVLRRSAGGGGPAAPVFRAGRVRIDPGQRRVWVDLGDQSEPIAGRLRPGPRTGLPGRVRPTGRRSQTALSGPPRRTLRPARSNSRQPNSICCCFSSGIPGGCSSGPAC